VLDDLLDVFGRKDRKRGSAKPGGFAAMLSSVLDEGDDHAARGKYAAPRHGFGDSDDSDDREYRTATQRSRRGFSFDD